MIVYSPFNRKGCIDGQGHNSRNSVDVPLKSLGVLWVLYGMGPQNRCGFQNFNLNAVQKCVMVMVTFSSSCRFGAGYTNNSDFILE